VLNHKSGMIASCYCSGSDMLPHNISLPEQ